MFHDLTEPQRIAYCLAVANLIGADGRSDRQERTALQDLLLALELDPEDPELAARLEKEMREPGPIAAIVEAIEARSVRLSLLRMMVDLAWLDGHLDERERERIAEVAQELGLPESYAEDLSVFIDPPHPDRRQQELFCEAAAAVMLADKIEAPRERALIDALVKSYGLESEAPPLRERLCAPRSLSESLRAIGPRPIRIYLMRYLVEVAYADGELCMAEQRALREAADAMEIEPTLAEELIAWGHEQALAARLF